MGFRVNVHTEAFGAARQQSLRIRQQSLRMASAWQGAGRAKQDTDAFLEAFKRGMPAAELQRLMRGGPLPPPPPPPRRNHRRRARSRAARETRRERDEGRERELEIEKRFKTLEHEVFVAAKAREKSMRRRVDTIGSVASGLREELAEQQARVSKVEEGQRMQKRAETTAASLARALKGRLDELALRVAEQDENAQAQNGRLRERFAELQQQHARLGREQQELASSVAGLRVAGLRALAQSTPAVEGAGAVDYMADNPMIASCASCASSPLPLPTAAESSIAPLTRSSQLARLASAVLEPPVRSAPASARPYSTATATAATAATAVNAATATVTAPARARAQATIAPPPPPSPPRVLITRERCDAFLARHEQTCAAARPYVRTLCETVSAFKSSLRRAAPSAPTAASKTWPRSVPTPRAPAPPPPPRPTARPKGASKHEGRQARQRVRLADPEAEAASRKGVGPRTATSAVAYDDDDDDGQPAMTPLAAAAERLRQQRGRRGARVDDDDDDDHGGVYFGSRDNGARRYRSWLER